MTNTLARLTTSATVRSGLGIFALGLVAVAVLSACGGGDAVRAPTSTTTTTTTTFITSSSTATPTVAITPGTTVRYMIQGAITSVEGTTTSFTRDANFALTVIANSSLAATTGTYAVQAFMGDDTFSQGRWTKGSATVDGTLVTPVLSGTDSRAVHYLVTRDLATFTDGTYKCGDASTTTGSLSNSVSTDLRSTGLTYSGVASGGTVPADTLKVGAVVPYGRITISGGVATVSLTGIQVTGAGLLEQGYANQTLTFATPGSGPQYLDSYQSTAPGVFGEGAAFVLGQDASPNNILLGMAYRRAMSTGARYQGMVSIRCRS